MRSRVLRIINVVCAVALMIALFALSAQSQLSVPGGFDFGDKIVHAAVYGLLAQFYALTAERSSRRVTLYAILGAVAYGVTDELHQSFVPGRDASVFDLVADAVGATLGALFIAWYSARRWPAPSSASEASAPASPRTSSSPISPR
ncbi:MAG TPA: VanZ family protein [Kofleriaceae bacterium]|nr:VanZ family protein [Kofleriaceae bacterium]